MSVTEAGPTPSDGRARREDIARSWQRVTRTGLDPTTAMEGLAPVDVDLRSPLLHGAEPVLTELADSLRGSHYATILVDRDCRIVHRWSDDPRIDRRFDELNVRTGASLLEESIGTNALGTAMTTRQGISVNGEEHFAEALRGYSCYGHPIRHPLTKRIEGVLDITAVSAQASPLLPPIISRAVRDIEERLLAGSRSSEQSLFAAFQSAAGLRRQAIVAIGEDIVLSNHAASDLLGADDLALLRVIAEDGDERGTGSVELTLESGRAVVVELCRVGGAAHGVLLRVDPVSGDRARAVVHRSRAARRAVSPPLLVSGGPGTGRTTRARQLAGHVPPRFLRPARALLEGDAAWARDFEAAMTHSSGSVCVDGIDLLSDELLDLVSGWVDADARPDLLFTSGPVDALTGRAAALAGTAVTREELLPLSLRRREIPSIAASMLQAVAQAAPLHFSPSALEALTAHTWPGNLRELKAVVTHAARQRSAGGLTVADLPPAYRCAAPALLLTPREHAEREVIVATLREVDGNKVRAAEVLCMSRTTLYSRMRTLSIHEY